MHTARRWRRTASGNKEAQAIGGTAERATDGHDGQGDNNDHAAAEDLSNAATQGDECRSRERVCRADPCELGTPKLIDDGRKCS